MASKKYSLVIGVICLLLGFSVQAQYVGSYDWKDSSVIPSKRQPQQNEFLNNQYPFPAKPRNQWEIGVKAGVFGVSGDVRSVFPTPGFGLHVRKALGYVFSLRGEYTWGRAKGLNFSPSVSYQHNPAWNANYDWAAINYVDKDRVYYNYRTTVNEASVQGVVTLNNIRFHKSKTAFNIYGFAGIGGMIYNTKINALGSDNQPYDFNSIANSTNPIYKNRKDIKKALKDMLDDSYETKAEPDSLQPTLFKKPFKPVFVVGAGIAFKLNKTLSLAFEDKFSTTKSDLIDGQQWQENSVEHPAQSRDYDAYNFFSVGLNFAIGGKSVEPLWWLNPLDYAYNELNVPRHTKFPKPVLDDSDNDGVTDQFDREPNTPEGCPVDTHGVSRDTDGDGVPDCKDKELITPTQCQPVDADGVGKCPCPDEKCFEGLVKEDNTCHLVDLPAINFKGNSTRLTSDAEALLSSVATLLRGNPNCRIIVCGSAAKSKAGMALGQKRVDAVVAFLVEKQGISSNRVEGQYDCHQGDPATVELRSDTVAQ